MGIQPSKQSPAGTQVLMTSEVVEHKKNTPQEIEAKENDDNITEFSFRKKNAKQLPIELAFYTNLVSLDVSWNMLQTYPGHYCARHKKVKRFVMSFNEIKSLPEEIGLLRHLDVLDLQTNCIHFLPGPFDNLIGLKELYLSSNFLEAFPHELYGFSSLTRLDIGHNRLSRVGKTLGTLKCLSHLSLAHNILTTIPPEVGKLQLLRTLDLNNNKIASLPPQIGKCKCLQHLDMDNNLLEGLPEELSQCKELKVLRVSHNSIRMLAAHLTSITSIQEIHAAHNQIFALLGNFAHLTNLQVLHLQGNSLDHLPPEIGHLHLNDLDISENEHIRVPLLVNEGGTQSLKCYLQTIGEQHRLMNDHMDDLIQSMSKAANTRNIDEQASMEGARLATLNLVMLADAPHVKATEAERAQIQEDIVRTRQRLSKDAEVLRPILATKPERQKMFRESLEHTRRILDEKDMNYGNMTMRQIQRAQKTGI